MTNNNSSKLDQIVANAHRNRTQREQGYRERALKLYAWICGRCSREFTRENLQELTVHHRDHNHDHNPEDGSNWELLCVYCHDNEHSRYEDSNGIYSGEEKPEIATHKAFAGLADLFKK
ncbi:MAG TPA: HNH nuclease family protein [Gammaproteobacteria bacterium]|nr:HNH nuclease family protein [Gammaproteobacteria bacterium]